jgi:hypothetical protein
MIGLADLSRGLAVVSVTGGLLAGAVVAAGAEQRLIAEVGHWRAVEANQGGRRYCFVIANPIGRTPPDLKRDPASFFVSLRPPSARAGTEVSIELGFPAAPTGNTLDVDGETWVLTAQKENAWLAREADEARLVEAMRAGHDLRILARSTRGNLTTDLYGLQGFTAALTALRTGCRP